MFLCPISPLQVPALKYQNKISSGKGIYNFFLIWPASECCPKQPIVHSQISLHYTTPFFKYNKLLNSWMQNPSPSTKKYTGGNELRLSQHFYQTIFAVNWLQKDHASSLINGHQISKPRNNALDHTKGKRKRKKKTNGFWNHSWKKLADL